MGRAREVRRVVRGPDGIRARVNGSYAEVKLSFLDNYLPPALAVTLRKPERVYIDLFAGPGLSFAPDRGTFHHAAALRALRLRSSNGGRVAFTRAILVNLNPDDHAALTARIDRLDAEGKLALPRGQVETLLADANDVVRSLLPSLNRHGYVFAFADPESPNQWPWGTVKTLRELAPRSTDLYMLLPDRMGVQRLLAYAQDRLEPNADALTRFFGTDAWRRIWERRVTTGQRRELQRDLGRLYHGRLRELWRYVRSARRVNRAGNAGLYSMVFATEHAAGHNLARWESEAATIATPARQIELFGLSA